MTDTVKIISPVDGSVYAERPLASGVDVETAVIRAQMARRAWGETTLAERQKIVSHLVDALLLMNDEIVPELAWQMGRPVRYGGEKGGVEERARYMIGLADSALAPIALPQKDNFTRYITREALGIVLVIAPWNYPFLTAVNSIVPALVAGNAVILKHASQTLLAGERFALAAEQAGLPAGLFQNLVMGHADTETLIGSGQIDHINFTGSVEGGRRIEKAAAGTFATLGLELGGKDPAYVRADAKIEHAVESLVDGSFFNSGQSCCGIERIYVHGDVCDRFVDEFLEAASGWTLGNPFEADTMVGPMARGSFADHVRQQTEEAERGGAVARLNTRHKLDVPGSPYLTPEVLTGVNHQMSVMREESFGPVVGIMKVADDAEAIALMNDSPYGLTASIWTNDLDAAAQLGSRIETGTVFANRCDYLDPGLVWTGVKDTGKGGSLSEIGYANLTQPKSYHLKRV
ncbi:aldehyde dehydrogenase family protein [Devosia neptuniae]|jgi:acyl-CoA reductase-like NAD-dependent aldehyde dehydrogenase|uniref:aldehyde dehydrogenase family protein n=1 Tax=Devosia TaxID=46913 RepID=UPI0022AF430D|nr:aldehyde dehydrogenase family protein [Devosia neptuniae]MCZ4346983.1 aldehyde dehydrogenase family protein [Devosia neptuniae]|tara:strand:+ start:5053 stop:6435 length:1383 start_codon:yes stop_codon:yes gene_type:complete